MWGPSGIGKSKTAHKVIKRLAVPGAPFDEVKCENGFWIGCHDDCDICLYDDFRDSDLKCNEFIRFIDYNKHIMNIKGGSMINNYKLIIITSIKSPWELYKNKNEEEKKQWIRRMDIYRGTDNGWKWIRDAPGDEDTII